MEQRLVAKRNRLYLISYLPICNLHSQPTFSHNRWYGIELDEPKGRHDGTVQDVRYFAAPDDHGVFVTESKLTKVNNSPKSSNVSEDADSNTFSMNYHTLEDSLEQNINEPPPPTAVQQPLKPRPLRRSLSMQHRAAKV